MEDFSINKAHQQRRRAETYLKQNKFDESIQCHQNAAELLAETVNLTTNVFALESLNLQIKHHQRQVLLIEKKKAHAQKELSRKSEQARHDENASLEAIVNKTIEVHDSLIEYLGKKENDDNSLKSYSKSDTAEKNENTSSQTSENKHPKDDAQIIEELKLLGGQLRNTALSLVVQSVDRKKEIERLKGVVKTLENETQKGTENQC